MKNKYLFTSARLGFRRWQEADIPFMSAINADPQVMEFFPATQSEEQTREFVGRMQRQMEDTGYCYFAVDRLDTGAFIGFIGLSDQTFESAFTPCVDIGWRLARDAWGQGFATEGAQRCLAYAFDSLGLETIKSHAPAVNKRSEEVMKKIGMKWVMNFPHPKLAGDERLQECVLYEIHAP